MGLVFNADVGNNGAEYGSG